MIRMLRSNFNTWATEYQLMFTIALFNIVDFCTTKVLIDRHGSLDIEANPLLRYPMVFFDSVWVILMTKLILIACAWLVMVRYYDPSKHRVAKLSLWMVLLAGIAVSIFNFGLISVWN